MVALLSGPRWIAHRLCSKRTWIESNELHQRPRGHDPAMKKSSNLESIVFVIDDDASVQAALRELFESVGLQVEPFASGESFLTSNHPDATSCLLLDVRLPGMSGLKSRRN